MEAYKKNNRPVFLNLLRIHLPIGAVVSITHRLSGIVLFLLIPFFLYLLDLSLQSKEGYRQVALMFDSIGVRVILMVLAWGFAHHLFNGIRHLLIDVDIGADRAGGRLSAKLVIGAGIFILGLTAILLL